MSKHNIQHRMPPRLGAKRSLLCLAGNTLLTLGFTVATLLRQCEPATSSAQIDSLPVSDNDTCAADSFSDSLRHYLVSKGSLERQEAHGLLLCGPPVPATLLVLRSWRTLLAASLHQVGSRYRETGSEDDRGAEVGDDVALGADRFFRWSRPNVGVPGYMIYGHHAAHCKPPRFYVRF